jgi:energy-converting hydrogenase B subunit D
VSILTVIVLGFLLTCAVATCLTKDLLVSVIIFMAYSLLMSILWILLQSPDLAITEAAVGAGVTGILFFITLKKLHAIKVKNSDEKDR